MQKTPILSIVNADGGEGAGVFAAADLTKGLRGGN
jgi:hypothetical protein